MRTSFSSPTPGALRSRLAFVAVGSIFLGLSCTENLPSGPETFGAHLEIVLPRDTLVVGDSSTAQARTIDASGRVVQSLAYTWTSADPTILDFAAGDTSSGRTRRFVGKKPGRSLVTLSLADPRFTTTNVTRNEAVVVGGVRILSTRDSTLTAINDTAFAIAAGLVRSNGALVTRVSQGIKWTHLGTRTTVVGTGDTIRYISKVNGADTLIATHEFCLAGAKCADTAIVRVSQQLALTLSSKNFTAWSFSDTLAPTVTLADRRGNGLAGTTIRFVPLTAADSAIVSVTPALGTTNPATGVMAAPRLVTVGNGLAQVAVQGIAPDGFTVIATDQIFATVRQVARRVQVEPLRALETYIDSIPIKPLARDARGAIIPDATVSIVSSGIAVNGIWAGPSPFASVGTQATITPTLTGVALPQSNPTAPQVAVITDPAVISIIALDSVQAGTTQRTVSVTVIDSNGVAAAGSWVRFRQSSAAALDSVQVDANGVATIAWTPPNVAGPYTLTVVRSTKDPLATVADSAGRIVIRRSVVVVAGPSIATTSSVVMSPTTLAINTTSTVTITVRDQFGNPVKTSPATGLSFSASRGTIGAASCNTEGVCTATYTAPSTAGSATVSVQILGVEVPGSPITLTITP